MIMAVVIAAAGQLAPPGFLSHLTVFVLACFVVTIGVASRSWFLLEKPFNALKDRFARSGL